MKTSLSLVVIAASVSALLFMAQPLPAADAAVECAAKPGGDQIWNGPCSWMCTPTSPCDRECWDGSVQTTCGDYGVCVSGTCYPNWTPISETVIGVFDRQDVFNLPACEVLEVVRVTWTDTNDCGDPDWTSCYHRQIGYNEDGFCCGVYWSCFGPRGCGAAGY